MKSLFPCQPRLETDLFLLREILAEEIDSLVELAFWGGKPVKTVEQARESIRKTSDEYSAGRCYHWIAESKTDGRVVGCIGYYRGFEDRQGEVGYVMKAEFQGKGIMTELLGCALGFGFREKGLERIIAVTHSENAPSLALLKRAGFIYEKDRDEGYQLFALSRKAGLR